MPARTWFWGGLTAVAVVAVGTAAIALRSSAGEAGAMATPRFVEEAAAAGIAHTYDGGFTFFVGGGVAVLDCDEDGRPDVYLAGGENPAGLYRNVASVGGELAFDAVHGPETALTGVTGAYPIDIDGDGPTDLAVLRLGENILLRGIGDCRFERANEGWGFDGGDVWTTAFSATWEADAELPTLAIGNYVAVDAAGLQTGGCVDNALVRPEGAEYGAPELLAPGWCSLSMLFSDWSRSGRADLRVANDRQYYRDGQEQLWRIDAGDPPSLYASDEGWKDLKIFGMGIASYDVTGDGRPEVFLTSMGDNKLQTLEDGGEQPSYRDIALDLGVTAHRPFLGDQTMPSTAWHAEFQDVNNDGYIDLYVTKGNVDAMVEAATEDPSNLLLGQADGTFAESAEAAGIVNLARGRGAALADFNLDGMLDVIEVNRGEPAKLWRSVGWGLGPEPAAMGDWLALRLAQPAGNRDAVGAWIEVRAGSQTMQREVTVGGGHGSGQLGWIHFGLGDADSAQVRVQWPGGEVGPWLDVEPGRFFTIEQEGGATVWDPSGA